MDAYFEITDVTVNPQTTGKSQYIKIEVEIDQYYFEQRYASQPNTEVYAGQGIGII